MSGIAQTTALRSAIFPVTEWSCLNGGFYHDGRFADLMAVVEHYDQFMKLGLSNAEKHDLVEYLKSL